MCFGSFGINRSSVGPCQPDRVVRSGCGRAGILLHGQISLGGSLLQTLGLGANLHRSALRRFCYNHLQFFDTGASLHCYRLDRCLKFDAFLL